MLDIMKNLFTRRRTDNPAFLTRQMTLHLAAEEGHDLAKAMLELLREDGILASPEVTRLRRWAAEFVEIYGPTAEALRSEREEPRG